MRMSAGDSVQITPSSVTTLTTVKDAFQSFLATFPSSRFRTFEPVGSLDQLATIPYRPLVHVGVSRTCLDFQGVTGFLVGAAVHVRSQSRKPLLGRDDPAMG